MSFGQYQNPMDIGDSGWNSYGTPTGFQHKRIDNELLQQAYNRSIYEQQQQQQHQQQQQGISPSTSPIHGSMPIPQMNSPMPQMNSPMLNNIGILQTQSPSTSPIIEPFNINDYPPGFQSYQNIQPLPTNQYYTYYNSPVYNNVSSAGYDDYYYDNTMIQQSMTPGYENPPSEYASTPDNVSMYQMEEPLIANITTANLPQSNTPSIATSPV